MSCPLSGFLICVTMNMRFDETQMTAQDEKFDGIHRLIKGGDIVALRRELDSGLDPNLKNRFGWSLLMLAALHGRTDLVDLLKQKGADTSAHNDFGDTAATLAAIKGHKKTTRHVEPTGGGCGLPPPHR